MKLAKALWSLGSLLVNMTIISYIVLTSGAPTDPEARFQYVNDRWKVFALHWKIEFLLMAMIAIGALYFTLHLKKISWCIISVGQTILLMYYPVMLGGYHQTQFEIYSSSNLIAIIVFIFGNLVFLSGLFHLYLQDHLLKSWIKYIAVVLSAVTALIFMIAFAEIIHWKQALMVGPLVNVIYLINAYYGLKLKLE